MDESQRQAKPENRRRTLILISISAGARLAADPGDDVSKASNSCIGRSANPNTSAIPDYSSIEKGAHPGRSRLQHTGFIPEKHRRITGAPTSAPASLAKR
jgi:hypothetical protein